MPKNLVHRIIILFTLLQIQRQHFNILFALLRILGHVIYLNVTQKVVLDTLQTANLDFAENSVFYIHILCYMVL